MPRFHYIARDSNHSLAEGHVDAVDATQAARILIAEGLHPSEIARERARSGGTRESLAIWRSRVTRRHLALMTRQLSDLVKGRVPLASALALLGRELAQPVLSAVVTDVGDRVESGALLSEALGNHPHTFGRFYTGMVASGEAVGRLPEVLDRLADRLEADVELRDRIRVALAYPLLLLSAGVLATALLVVLVVPKLAAMYVELGQELPWPTQVVTSVSAFVGAWWWLLLLAAVTLVIMAPRVWRRDGVRARVDGLMLRLPVVGGLLHASEAGQFCRTLQALLTSGVPLMSALDIVAAVLGNHRYRAATQAMGCLIADGYSLSQAMRRSGVFSESESHIVAIGEDANEPEEALGRVARMYGAQLERVTRMLTSLIEPVLVVAVGSVIGFVVLAMMLPILQMDVTSIGG